MINVNVKHTDTHSVGHLWIWEHVTLVVDRSFDFVLAAVHRRTELNQQITHINQLISVGLTAQASVITGTSGMEMDQEKLMEPTQRDDEMGVNDDDEADGRGNNKRVKHEHTSTTIGVGEEEIDYEVEEDKRRGVDHVITPPTNAPNVDISGYQSELSELMNQLDIVTNSLTCSLEASHEIYKTCVQYINSLINARQAVLRAVPGAVEEEVIVLDALTVTASSLMKHVWRLYEQHQYHLDSISDTTTNSNTAIPLVNKSVLSDVCRLITYPSLVKVYKQYA